MDLRIAMDHIIVNSPNFSSFLEKAISVLKNHDPDASMAKISKHLGFTSRGRIGELMQGKRRLTQGMLEKIIENLNLVDYPAEVLRLKAMIEYPHLNVKKLPKAKLLKEHKQLVSFLDASRPDEKGDKWYQIKDVPYVYAALGDDNGATIAEIKLRTSFTKLKIRNILSFMVLNELCTYDDVTKRYKVIKKNINEFSMMHSKNFQIYLAHSLEKALDMVKTNTSSKDHLFLNSQFSINSKKIPHLRKELNLVLQKFINESEEPLGDKIATLNVAFFN